jgi:hypothetical protein
MKLTDNEWDYEEDQNLHWNSDLYKKRRKEPPPGDALKIFRLDPNDPQLRDYLERDHDYAMLHHHSVLAMCSDAASNQPMKEYNLSLINEIEMKSVGDL